MRLTVLGCNGPFPAPDGACSGYLTQWTEASLQLDLGCGTLARLTALTAPEDLTALLLTHWHYDHCSDVLPLLYRLESALSPERPLHVYAPEDQSSPVRRAAQACSAVRVHDLRPGDEVTLGGVRVRAYGARHPVPALMYRMTEGEQVFCYTGDTNLQPGLEDFARGADLLLADGLFPAAVWAEGKPHLSAGLAGALAGDAGVKRLIVTHLNPLIDPAGLLAEARRAFPGAVLARQGLTAEL